MKESIKNNPSFNPEEFRREVHEKIFELKGPLKNIFDQINDVGGIQEYGLIISEGDSALIPSIIIKKVMYRVLDSEKGSDSKKPKLRIFDDECKDVGDLGWKTSKEFSRFMGDRKSLIVTEVIFSGSSILKILKGLETRCDVATIGIASSLGELSNAKNAKPIMDILDEIRHTGVVEEVLEGGLDETPKVWHSFKGIIKLDNSNGAITYIDEPGKIIESEINKLSAQLARYISDE